MIAQSWKIPSVPQQHNGILLSSKKQWTLDRLNNGDESQRHHVEGEKPVSASYKPYDSSTWRSRRNETVVSDGEQAIGREGFWVRESMATQGVVWGQGTAPYPDYGGAYPDLYMCQHLENCTQKEKEANLLYDNFLIKLFKNQWFETKSTPCPPLSLPQYTASTSSSLCSWHSPQALTQSLVSSRKF